MKTHPEVSYSKGLLKIVPLIYLFFIYSLFNVDNTKQIAYKMLIYIDHKMIKTYIK